jgi:uncharacterized protein YcbK (DUF882 family)
MENVSFETAKLKELQYWMKNKVYTEHVDIGQKCVSTRWIWTLKESSEGIRPKARLVARGLKESQINNTLKDSPTCSTESLRLTTKSRNSEQTSFCVRYSEQILNITEQSEHRLNMY